jgi:hypothetical protein
MKQLAGLGFAALLGLAAAGLNWFWISGLATPDEFVAIQTDLSAGDVITEDDLLAVPIPGNVETLRQAFIPWRNRAVLFGAPANRDYLEGDVVLHRDLQPPAEASRWDVIGPFQLISVGERFKQQAGDEFDTARTDGNNLTIAVDANFDERTRKLLEVIRTDRDTQLAQPAIVAVQVLPANQRSTAAPTPASENVVYQTVSLDGIANVPRVLLEGDMIRFVIPARSSY